MATMTAQILIGRGHPNHDGINPTHYLFLSENGAPAWILVNENIFSFNSNRSKITWIPTVENMLEDAILMIAVHVLKDHKISAMFNSFFENDEARIKLYDLQQTQRNELYQQCREHMEGPKLIISVFQDSSIINQLPVLNQYKMDVEICQPTYTRLYSPWGGNIIEKGNAPKPR